MPQPIDQSEITQLLERWEESQHLSDEISSSYRWYVRTAYDFAQIEPNELLELSRTINSAPEYDGCAAVLLVLKPSSTDNTATGIL